jgi:hypothetical protein
MAEFHHSDRTARRLIPMAGRREEIESDRREAARRALERVHEGEVVGTSAFARAADRLGAHFGAADRDPNDAVEVWGSRVGRGFGLVAFVALAVYLFVTYVA